MSTSGTAFEGSNPPAPPFNRQAQGKPPFAFRGLSSQMTKKQDDFMAQRKAKREKEIQAAYWNQMKPIAKELTSTYFAYRQDCNRMILLHDNLLAEIAEMKEKYK